MTCTPSFSFSSGVTMGTPVCNLYVQPWCSRKEYVHQLETLNWKLWYNFSRWSWNCSMCYYKYNITWEAFSQKLISTSIWKCSLQYITHWFHWSCAFQTFPNKMMHVWPGCSDTHLKFLNISKDINLLRSDSPALEKHCVSGFATSRKQRARTPSLFQSKFSKLS